MQDDSTIHRITALGIVVGLVLAATMLVSAVKGSGNHYNGHECAGDVCPAGR